MENIFADRRKIERPPAAARLVYQTPKLQTVRYASLKQTHKHHFLSFQYSAKTIYLSICTYLSYALFIVSCRQMFFNCLAARIKWKFYTGFAQVYNLQEPRNT